jgi:hypothetical protein
VGLISPDSIISSICILPLINSSKPVLRVPRYATSARVGTEAISAGFSDLA